VIFMVLSAMSEEELTSDSLKLLIQLVTILTEGLHFTFDATVLPICLTSFTSYYVVTSFT